MKGEGSNELSPRKAKRGLNHLRDAFIFSTAGIKATFINEEAFRQEILIAAILIPIALFLSVSGIGKALMIGSILIVLIVELLNSAIETTVDRISLDHHHLSKRAKDIGSAAVLLSLINVIVIWTFVLFG